MIRHCAMFRWNPGTSEEVIAEISAGLDALAKKDFVSAYAHGPDLGMREGNFEYVVVGDFADAQAYEAYASDEDHLALLKGLIGPNISDRASLQYSI